MYLSKFSFEPDTGKGNGIFDVMIRSDKPGQNFVRVCALRA